MTAPTIKICGLRTHEIVRSMRGLPVDQIGFVFADSRRRVSPKLARELIGSVREGSARPQSFGVFVNPTLAELAAVLSEAPLDAVQLHGQETPEFCREVRESLGLAVYKVFSVAAAEDKEKTAADIVLPYQGVIDGVFIDTYDPLLGGGTGRTFAWEAIPVYLRAVGEIGVPLIVAGGLTAVNVGGLLAQYKPHGVDVSSGVETNGEKDSEKIRQFVERVKNYATGS